MVKGSEWLYNRLNEELAEAEKYVFTHGVGDDEYVEKKAVKDLLSNIIGLYRLGVTTGVIYNG